MPESELAKKVIQKRRWLNWNWEREILCRGLSRSEERMTGCVAAAGREGGNCENCLSVFCSSGENTA